MRQAERIIEDFIEQISAAGRELFDANHRQRERLREVVSLLVDLINCVEAGDDWEPVVARAREYLLVDTNLSVDCIYPDDIGDSPTADVGPA